MTEAQKKENEMKRRTKRLLVSILSMLFVFTFGILLGVYGERYFAAGRMTDYGRTKYYASYTVRPDDTLWTIASDLMPLNPEYQDIRQYVEEIRRLNDISPDGGITAGHGLILPYFFDESALTQEETYERYNIRILDFSSKSRKGESAP